MGADFTYTSHFIFFMIRSFLLLSALGTLLLIGAANAGAQQTHPSKAASQKPAPHTPVSATGERSSSVTKASGANSTLPAATSTPKLPSVDTTDGPNKVNANGSIGSQAAADGKGQGAYAAPGMPIDVSAGQKPASYNGKPATSRPKNNSTLKSGGKP